MPRVNVDDHFQELMTTDWKFRFYFKARMCVHHCFYVFAWAFAFPLFAFLFVVSKLIPWARFAFNDFANDASDVLEQLSWNFK